MSNLFQRVQQQAFKKGIDPKTREARDWFQKRARDLRRINRDQLLRDNRMDRSSSAIAGSMYMFFYDPKTKDQLPFYDRFPLTVVVQPAKGGFHGLNLHYLPPVLRAKFLDELMGITNNEKYDDSTKFRLTYQLLKGSSKFDPFAACFKHYLSDHVRSQFSKVHPEDWEIATFLPTAQWQKSGSQSVYAASRKIINAL